MSVKITMRGIEAVQEYLKTVPRGALKDALAAFTEYIVGNEQHGLKHADPYKFVTRKAAYGFPFFTDKQRKWFFWALNTGQIDPGSGKRSGESTGAWKAEPRNDGYRYTISNPTAGAYYTQSDTGQARQPALVGWRKVAKNIEDNLKGAMRSANAAVKRRLARNK